MEDWLISLLVCTYLTIGFFGGRWFWRKLDNLGIKDGDGLGGFACLVAWPIAFTQYYLVIKAEEEGEDIKEEREKRKSRKRKKERNRRVRISKEREKKRGEEEKKEEAEKKRRSGMEGFDDYKAGRVQLWSEVKEVK